MFVIKIMILRTWPHEPTLSSCSSGTVFKASTLLSRKPSARSISAFTFTEVATFHLKSERKMDDNAMRFVAIGLGIASSDVTYKEPGLTAEDPAS